MHRENRRCSFDASGQHVKGLTFTVDLRSVVIPVLTQQAKLLGTKIILFELAQCKLNKQDEWKLWLFKLALPPHHPRA